VSLIKWKKYLDAFRNNFELVNTATKMIYSSQSVSIWMLIFEGFCFLMNLALTTTLPSPIVFGERVEHLPRVNAEASAFHWVPGKRPHFIKDPLSLEKRPTIDMEARKDFGRPFNPTLKTLTGIDYYLRNALITYFEIAGESIPSKHIIDLYV
jgi:hypothetical protein